jgi:hypothetical protein
MSLIDERDYHRVDIVVPASDTPRARLARLAAEVATKNFHSSSTVQLPSDDLAGMLNFVADHYQRYYAHGNFDFELGLPAPSCTPSPAPPPARRFASPNAGTCGPPSSTSSVSSRA